MVSAAIESGQGASLPVVTLRGQSNLKRMEGQVMILASSENIEGRQVSETLGLVRGNAVRARGIGSDFVAGIRNLFG